MSPFELTCPLLMPRDLLGLVVTPLMPRNWKPGGTVRNYQFPDALRYNKRRAHTMTRTEGRAEGRRRRRRGWGGVEGSRKCIGQGLSGRCGIGACDRLARAAEKPVTGRSGAIPALRPADW